VTSTELARNGVQRPEQDGCGLNQEPRTKAHQYIGIIGFQPEMHVFKLKPSRLN